MWIRKRSWVAAACLLAASPFVAATESAEGLDGSKDMVCAVIRVVSCTEGGGCVLGQARDFDVPTLVVYDAQEKAVRGTHESGHKEVSPVKTMERSNDHLILQGIEAGHGWVISIGSKTGVMRASIVGEAVKVLMSGACTAL
jgi:hypothetical protein